MEGGLYAAFLSLDLLGLSGRSLWIKYSGILLCLLYALLCALRGGSWHIFFALLLTAGADLFLLVLNRFYFLGLSLFLMVQLLYLLYLRRQGAGLGLPLRLGLALAMLLAVCFSGLFSPVNLLAGLYFSQLLANAFLAWRGPAPLLFSLGLSLFIGCDLCVGLFNLQSLIPAGLYQAAALGMWLFYLPSQVLIALAARPKKGDVSQ